jgi:atypical dual specificity phosphatase
MEYMKERTFESLPLTDSEKAFLLPPTKLVLKIDPTCVKVTHSSGGKTTTEELSSKLKKTEDKDPDSAIESYGSPGSKKDSRENKAQCQRCEHWVHKDEINSHMNSHSSQILDWLYLGGYRNSSNHKELTVRTNIGCILNVAIECQNSFPDQFSYKKYDLYDNTDQDISAHFEEASEFIEEARKNAKNVLVHCIQGMSRSASFVMAYLILKQSMTLREAYGFVTAKRSIVKPNPGFLEQLIKLETKVLGSASMTKEEIYSPLIKTVMIGTEC